MNLEQRETSYYARQSSCQDRPRGKGGGGRKTEREGREDEELRDCVAIVFIGGLDDVS